MATKKAAPKKSSNGGGYDDTNRMVIFKQDDATPENRKPTFTGKLDVEGTEYRISLWPQTSKATGKKFLSGSIQLPDPAYSKGGGKADDAADEDDIGF